ncbi:MAG: galactose/methyl galactoside ABC transporter permease MglC [Defluviitaleaceae bacterium]|nr:galactose/methyl galactoside ABC transporter permease MglC [Defluviitaleaceae bacterium]
MPVLSAKLNLNNFDIKEFIIDKAMYFVLLVLILLIIVVEPQFLSLSNFTNIAAQSATRIIIALGAAMVLIIRGVDLAAGRMIGLAAVVSASLLQAADFPFRMHPNLPELPVFVPILLVMVICGAFGAISGISCSVFKVPPFIATLAMSLLLFGVTSLYFDRPPYGAMPIGGISREFTAIATGSLMVGSLRVPYLIMIAAVVAVIIWLLWNKTKFGKYMYAIGGNPEAAKVSGVNVTSMIIWVYVIASMMYAFAATLEVARIGSASNNTGNGHELDAIAACVVGGVSLAGGVGKVGGVVVGVLIFTVINYGLSFIGVNMYYQFIVKGLIILVAVVIDMRKYKKQK